MKAVKNIVEEVKTNLQSEFDKIVGKVDAYYRNLVKSIAEKTESKIIELENNTKETQRKLQNLKDTMSLFEKHAPPLSNPVKRASFLKVNSIPQLTNKLEIDNFCLNNQLSDISQWKTDINKWNRSVTNLLKFVNDLPQITDNIRPILLSPKLRFVCTIFLSETGLYVILCIGKL